MGRCHASVTDLERAIDVPQPGAGRPNAAPRLYPGERASGDPLDCDRARAMNENFSLIVMCVFLLGSLAFLAQQLTSYH